LQSLAARRRIGASQQAGDRIPVADIDDPADQRSLPTAPPPARTRTGHRRPNRSRKLTASTGMGATSAHAPT
jgi:hypothetical protein